MNFVKDLSIYSSIKLETIKTAFYTLVLLIVCKITAHFLFSIHGHITSFDLAQETLLHYGKGVIGIYSLAVVSFIFLALTLTCQPSVIFSVLPRKYLAVPALKVSAHMLSISSGALMAWYLIESVEKSNFMLKEFFLACIACTLTLVVSYVSYVLHIYFKMDYEELVNKYGNWVNISSALISTICLIGLYHDYIYNIPLTFIH